MRGGGEEADSKKESKIRGGAEELKKRKGEKEKIETTLLQGVSEEDRNIGAEKK